MTNEVIVEHMKSLKARWAILKDEKQPKIDRRDACKSIIELSKEIKKLDKTFEEFDFASSKYAEFIPKGYIRESNVNWKTEYTVEEETVDKIKLAAKMVENFEVQAVELTKQRLPNEPEDSQKFGMIVSAYTDKIERAYIFLNS